MDRPVTARRCLILLLSLSLSLALTLPAAGAQAAPAVQHVSHTLRDPTRPPDSLLKPAGGAAAPVTPVAPQLQSILMARHPGGRNVAVIDGVMLRPGDRYRGALLERMSETEVVLVRGKTRQVLTLFPTPPERGQR